MRNANFILMTASDATSQNSINIDVNQIFAISFQFIFSDTTAAGTVKIQASNDINHTHELGPFTPTNWVDIPNATATITAGSAALISIPQSCYQQLRAVWTANTPGVGTLTIEVNTQGY